MKNFYGQNINEIQAEYLLKATPFNKEPRINFSGYLTEEYFFKNLFTDFQYDKEDIPADVNKFNRDIENVLFSSMHNKFAKVDLIHIAGYGGCGKTTFIRHLLWKNKEWLKTKVVVDFEGERYIEDVYIDIISTKISEDINKKGTSIIEEMIHTLESFDLRRFRNLHKYGICLCNNITDLSINIDKQKIYSQICKIKKNLKSQFIDFLMAFYFMYSVNEYIHCSSTGPLVIVFDNVDSIDDLEEEGTFISKLKEFVNDCNFFFGLNMENTHVVCGKEIKEILHDFKLICFLTTRIVTIQKFIELEPDIEKVYGWKTLEIPEHYYNHSLILKNRIDYYIRQETDGNDSSRISELIYIKNFIDSFYKANLIKKLFNGNIRFCIDALCKICDEFSTSSMLNQINDLYSKRMPDNESIDGALGMVLSLIINYFKANGIYQEKLHLSECLPNNEVTLSRLILTILREKGGSCSLLEIFDCLSPFFDTKSIVQVIYDMCEAKRKIWRRLLIFITNFPQNYNDILAQEKQYRHGVRDFDKFSMLKICLAGETYLEMVVPHFEFMLSRHKYDYQFITNKNYHPLFSDSSEDIIEGKTAENIKFRFERKIDWVFADVCDCCQNSRYFANTVMKKFHWDANNYMYYSFYNFRTFRYDGTAGYKQSYASRLIFNHIGYIERYRRYLLKKYETKPELFRKQINQKLVERIKKYIDLYSGKLNIENKCLKTPNQDEAAKHLYQCIELIEKKNYMLFDTRIGD